jgi:hypothetical protein
VLKEITSKGAVVITPDNKEMLLPADYVVIAFGAVSNNPLDKISSKIANCQVIGDAVKPGKIKEAIADGFFAALRI